MILSCHDSVASSFPSFASVPSPFGCGFPRRAFLNLFAANQHKLLSISTLHKNAGFFAVFSGVPAAIGFVLLCALCDSARAMKPNEITAQIVHAAYRVHTQLGPGLLETVPEQRGDPVGSGKDFRAESAENAERAQGACGVGEAVDMAIPPKTARNQTQAFPIRANRAQSSLIVLFFELP
jgi:hypothetical protein